MNETFNTINAMGLGYAVFPPKIILLKDGKETGMDCSQELPHDTIKIIVKDYEIIVIPIS